MPSLIDLRRRIRAVKSTQQITKAMKMIAASRLRKSQERVVNARPFAIEALRMLRDLAARTDASAHPLLAVREEKTVLAFVLTADKGLCGSFNTNIIKAAGQAILARSNQMVMLGLIGRKGRDFFRRRGYPVAYERVNVFQHLKFEDAEDIANVAIEQYAAAKVDAVYLIYNEFKSVIQQRIVAEKLLPIPRADLNEVDAAARVDYIYEPDPADALRPDPARPRPRAGVACAARVGGGRERRAHDGDGRGHEERHRHDRQPDALHEQGAPGGHHARDHRGGVGSAGAVDRDSGLGD